MYKGNVIKYFKHLKKQETQENKQTNKRQTKLDLAMHLMHMMHINWDNPCHVRTERKIQWIAWPHTNFQSQAVCAKRKEIGPPRYV